MDEFARRSPSSSPIISMKSQATLFTEHLYMLKSNSI